MRNYVINKKVHVIIIHAANVKINKSRKTVSRKKVVIRYKSKNYNHFENAN